MIEPAGSFQQTCRRCGDKFMCSSFTAVVFTPIFLYVWLIIFRDFFRYLRHRGEEEQINSDVLQNESPILVLEFHRPRKTWLSIIVLLEGCLLCFFAADMFARDDMHRLFFFMNKEQTYILYYWTWKFISMSFFVWVVLLTVNTACIKKVSFFKNIVIFENLLTGRKSLILDNNVRFTKNWGDIYWLYNKLSMKHFKIFDRNYMNELNPQQEKLFYEFLSKIPEKKKIFVT
jgi:hypothetical protein